MSTDLAEPPLPTAPCPGVAAQAALVALHRYIQLAACGAAPTDLVAAQADIDACLEIAGIDEADLVPRYPSYRVFALISALRERTCE